ncbi:MAG: DUF1697 domain-containing protein [Rhizobiales bacterium]|nr:DUF1697 domain-containing protein [Hyphomicrobiales bacterium]
MADQVYIILFRGIGGATQLPTAPLREALVGAGFRNVATYINSGNVVLRTDMPRDAMLERVAALCAERFGFRKEIYAPSLGEWTEAVARCPFTPSQGKDLHIAWLAATPAPARLDALRALAVPGEGIEVIGNIAYLHTPGGVSHSKLGVKFDKGVGVPNTARNWNTALKLRDLGEAAAR